MKDVKYIWLLNGVNYINFKLVEEVVFYGSGDFLLLLVFDVEENFLFFYINYFNFG